MHFSQYFTVYDTYSAVTTVLYIATIVLFFVSLFVSWFVGFQFRKYGKVVPRNGMTGIDAAQHILRANRVDGISFYQIGGRLTDNYNPINKSLNLSEEVCCTSSVSAVAVAAHECGHAIQHAQKNVLLMLRKTIVPVCNIGTKGSYIAIILGTIFSRPELVTIGAWLFSGIVLFNIITLPVEIDASRKAMANIEALNLLNEEERKGAKKVLAAAALTYFVSLVTSIVQFLRLVAMTRRRK